MEVLRELDLFGREWGVKVSRHDSLLGCGDEPIEAIGLWRGISPVLALQKFLGELVDPLVFDVSGLLVFQTGVGLGVGSFQGRNGAFDVVLWFRVVRRILTAAMTISGSLSSGCRTRGRKWAVLDHPQRSLKTGVTT